MIKKITKQTLCLLMVLCLLTALSGCLQKTSEEVNSSKVSGAQTTPVPAVSDTRVITDLSGREIKLNGLNLCQMMKKRGFMLSRSMENSTAT